MQRQCLPLNSSQTPPTDLFRATATNSQSRRTARPVAPNHQAAHRRAEVRRCNLSVCHLMAAKHIPPICSAQQKPNRRAVGRPGDARRPSALSRAWGQVERAVRGHLIEDLVVDSSTARPAHGCDRSQFIPGICAGRSMSLRIDREGGNWTLGADAPAKACIGRSRRWHTVRLHIQDLMRFSMLLTNRCMFECSATMGSLFLISL